MKACAALVVAISLSLGLATAAALPANADADSDDASMIHRTLAIYAIEADPVMVLDRGHDGWGVRLIASDGGTTAPHATGFTGSLTLSSGTTRLTDQVTSSDVGVTTPRIDLSRFTSGPIALHVELTTTGTADTAVYDNQHFVTARRNTTRVTSIDNGGCAVAGNRMKVLWGDFEVDGWGDRTAAITATQRFTRKGKVVLTRKLALPSRAGEVMFDKPWPRYEQEINWTWNGRIHNRVRPGLYRSQITVTDTITGKIYRLKRSPGLRVLPSSARTCSNVWFH